MYLTNQWGIVMLRHEDFKTHDIELAAALMTATGQKPRKIAPGNKLIEFIFPANEIVHSVVLKYAAGNLFQEVRRLAAHRRWLYRQIREVENTGREVRG